MRLDHISETVALVGIERRNCCKIINLNNDNLLSFWNQHT